MFRIEVFNSLSPGTKIPGFSVFFEFSLCDWQKMGKRLDWIMNLPKPFLELNKEALFYFVGEAVENKYTFIVPDYFTGKHSQQRFVITKTTENG